AVEGECLAVAVADARGLAGVECRVKHRADVGAEKIRVLGQDRAALGHIAAVLSEGRVGGQRHRCRQTKEKRAHGKLPGSAMAGCWHGAGVLATIPPWVGPRSA